MLFICNMQNQKADSVELLMNIFENYINTNFNNPNLSLDFISERLDMSRSKLHRFVKSQYDQTITEYINKVRITEAHYILQTDMKPVKEVAHEVGYKDPKYFSKRFKMHIGKPPTDVEFKGKSFTRAEFMRLATNN